jgi:peptidoglycan/LPS O-acetylase OafA/YrhL
MFGLIAWRRRDWLIPLSILLIVLGSLIRFASTGLFEYFSTFTRADAILLGCLIALSGVRLPAWTAGVGLAGLIAVAFLVAPENHALAIPLSMLAAAGVICGEFRPLARLAPAGLRAYSLYLWNWPMVLLFGAIPGLAVLLTILVGELSFRLFEAPVLRRGGIRAPVPALAAAGGGR